MDRKWSFASLFFLLLVNTMSFAQSKQSNPHGQIANGIQCSDCHITSAWIPLKDSLQFNHNKQTPFELIGKHNLVSCTSCHVQLVFKEPHVSNSECSTCHADVHLGNLGSDCQFCHNQNSFNQVDGFQIHMRTSFPLTGAHSQISCVSCHQDQLGGAFTPLQTDCYDCHKQDFESTRLKPVDHIALSYPTDCMQCHSTQSWSNSGFSHLASTGYPLIGAHADVQCESCHSIPNLDLIHAPAGPYDCMSCHTEDFNLAHDAGKFSTTCEACHSQLTWENPEFDHKTYSKGFELLGSHASLQCADCHSIPSYTSLFTAKTQNDCYSCHVSDYQVSHPGGNFPTTCDDCHTVNSFKNPSFEHSVVSNGFQLLGAHVNTQCTDCHTVPDYASLFTAKDQNDCISCHTNDYQRGHPTGTFPTTCTDCHSINSFTGASFDHKIASNGFELLGSHIKAQCSDCHSIPSYALIFQAKNQNDCVSCHTSDYQASHPSGKFPTTCVDCHNVNTFTNPDFDHSTVSNGFQLLGAHINTECSNCHTIPEYNSRFTTKDQNDCYSCHKSDYDKNHPSAAFPTMCTDCHTINSFKNASFDHVIVSKGFELLGSHNSIACASCHTLPDYGKIFQTNDQNNCYSCHTTDYQENHAGSTFPITCADCHNVNTFSDATFDHKTISNGFELLGSHNKIVCASCHVLPGYAPIFTNNDQNNCYSCHTSDYQASHPSGKFPTTCADCHNVNTFTNPDFDHSTVSNGFQLLGAHISTECSSCHTVPDYNSLFTATNQNDCYSCHKSDYDKNHPTGAFPTTCADCHNVNTFSDATFDHVTASNGFELLGSHNSIACASCHTLPDYGKIFQTNDQNDCYTCHTSDYKVSHPSGKFPTTCADCHTVSSFKNPTVDHKSLSKGFELLGAHINSECSSCHIIPEYSAIFATKDQNDCYTCHTKDYQENHAGSTFPTTCTDCHTVNTFSDATFDHKTISNGFELLGAHNRTECASCHVIPGYDPIFQTTGQNDCYSCHTSDYQSEHASNSYPLDCTICHTVENWSASNFTQHDSKYFPIYSGKHRNVWNGNCATCHTTPTNFNVFFCTNCHEHNKTDMDKEHRGKSGYVYQSSACYNCHPDGRD